MDADDRPQIAPAVRQYVDQLHAVVDQLLDPVHRAHADRLRCAVGCSRCCVDDLTVFEQQKGGNVANTVLARDALIVVDIHFADAESAFIIARHLLQDGCDCATRATPCCPEVDQYRYSAFHDI